MASAGSITIGTAAVTSPLNNSAVVAVLRDASCQQQPSLIRPAEEQLQNWEKQPGFYLTLMQVVLDQALELNVRWLAVLCLKNGVDKFWRTVGEQKISEGEKTSMRTLLLAVSCQGEPLPQLALQLAVIAGKIARQDCPTNWPDLLPALIQAVTASDGGRDLLVRQRALLTLHHVVKQVSSRRLLHQRRTFQELTCKLFGDIHNLWKTEVDLFIGTQQAGGDAGIVAAALQRAHYCLKILRKLAIYGFKTPVAVPEVAEFYSNICGQVKVMLLFRKQHEGGPLRPLAEKFVNLLMKAMLELLEHYPFCFLNYAKRALEIATMYGFAEDEGCLMYERFTVQCLNMIKCILDCPEYQVNKIVVDTKNPLAVQAYNIKCEFFTKEVLEQICHRLVTHYFILSREDLDTWETDPESFCTEIEGGDSWKFSLRPSTECLFRKMFHDYKDEFRPVLLSLMTDAMKMNDPSNFQGVLSKDAVYNAFGLASFELFDEVDFDNWFTTSLVHELKVEHSNYRILRKRVIWLIGQWTNVRFDAKNRPLLYEACIHLLTNDADFVVRYHTAMTLKTAIDDFDFDRKSFMPYLPTVFGLLFNLLKEAKECDVKMQILNVMSIMIEVVGGEVRVAADPLLQFLPALWDESEHHNLLRCAIITTMTHLVAGLGNDSGAMHSFLLKVLHLSTDTSQDSHVYLLEDALQLWLCVLENTTPEAAAAPDGLLALYANVLPILEASTENMQACLQLSIAYTICCPMPFLHKYGRELMEVLGSQVNDLRAEGLALVLRTIEAVVRTCLQDGVALVRGVVAVAASSLIKDETAQYPMLVSMHLSLLSRVLLVDYDSFLWIVHQLSTTCEQPEDSIITCLLRVWCSRLSVVTPDERRKLAALGLCRLLAVCHPAVLAVWTRAVEAVVEVVYDVTAEDEVTDKLVYTSFNTPTDEMPSNSSYQNSEYAAAAAEDDDAPGLSSWEDANALFDPDSAHSRRRQALARVDPVHTVPLRDCLGKAVLEFQRLAPPETLAALTVNMKPDVKSLLQEITKSLS